MLLSWYGIEWYIRIDSKKLEYGSRMIYAGFPSESSLGLEVGGQSYSNFPASTVGASRITNIVVP